jgi:hypothetical protein
VAESVTVLGNDVRGQLKEVRKEFQHSSVATEQSKDTKDITELAVFIRNCI